jgi:hypothetical protein
MIAKPDYKLYTSSAQRSALPFVAFTDLAGCCSFPIVKKHKMWVNSKKHANVKNKYSFFVAQPIFIVTLTAVLFSRFLKSISREKD